MDQPLLALRSRRKAGARLDQPILKGVVGAVGCVIGLPRECSLIVEREPRPDHQDVLPLQLLQGRAQGDMQGGVQPADEGKLQAGYVGLRVHELEGNEQAVVESPPVVDAGRDAALSQQAGDPVREPRIARSRIGERIGFFGKAVVVVEQRRSLGPQQGRHALLPMGAYHQGGFGLSEPLRQPHHEVHHRPVPGIAKNGQGTAAVRDIDDLGLRGRAGIHKRSPSQAGRDMVH